MTLIVGLKCRDGIVLGSDGAATFGALGQRTIRQPTKKLRIIRDGVVIGVSGPVGLGQQYAGALGDLWDGKQIEGQAPHVAMLILQRALWPFCEQQINVARVSQQTLGQSLAWQSVIAATVIAFPLGKDLHLVQFDHQCAPEEATDDLPFVAIGSGEAIADPFLAFLRRIFWPNSLPTLVDGVFAVYWTLQHAIEVNPGGVAEPKQIITLAEANGGFQARELAEADIEDHAEAVAAAEKRLREFKEGLAVGGISESAAEGSMPPPPSNS